MNWLADRFVQNRRLVAVVVLVVTVVALVGLSRLGIDDEPRGIFESRDAAHVYLEQVFADFGSDDNDCVLVVEAEDLFTPGALAAIRALVTEIGQIDGVEVVRSIADVVVFEKGALPRVLLPAADAAPGVLQRARDAALAHALIAGQLLSDDARTTLIIVRLAGDSLSIAEIEPIVQQIGAAITAGAQDSGVRVRQTGVPPIRVEIYRMLQRQQYTFGVVSTLTGIAIAVAVFRRPAAVLILVMGPAVGVIWTLGLLGWVGERINIINSVLPTLVIVIGFTDAVHLLHDMRRSRAAGLHPVEVGRLAVTHLGLPCALTALTTAIGFGSLAVADLEIIRRFGLTCAAGTIMAFLAVVTVVPLLGSTRLGWHIHRARPLSAAARAGRWYEACALLVTRRARLVAVGGVVLTLLLGSSAMFLRPDNSLDEAIPTRNESFQALQHCDRVFGGALFAYVVVEWSPALRWAAPEVLRALQDVHDMLDAESLTRGPLSLLDILHALPGDVADRDAQAAMLSLVPTDVLGRFVNEGRRRTLVAAHVRDAGTGVYEPVFDRLEQRLAEMERRHQGLTFHLTGTSVVAVRDVHRMIADLARGLLLAAGVIFGVMTVNFRSVRLGVISVLPNLFPLAAAAAVLVVTGQPLQITGVIVFTICLGIAVDDTIHFLARFRRELAVEGDVAAAIRRSLVAVGGALVTTTVVLLSGFGTIMLSEMPPVRLFAWLSCSAFAAALLGDVVILPALLMCFCRRRQAEA
ncbi:MAG: MMPL family transporter [Planctomycetes bacterium]|nr:MMPL family transporter [Planctomycetota bacterium]